MAGPPQGGVVIVDKPAGWTSHDVVARLRRAFGTRRVGHAGTLDPMATGVLVIGVDWATKLLTYVVGSDKSYAATIRLGLATTTDDAEGEPLTGADASGIAAEAVLSGIAALTGNISQRPSSVSAIKVDGRRAYARVRGGEDVVLAERPVTVHRFALSEMRTQAGSMDLDVIVDCSTGTYIRALARDLGEGLGVGGHLTSLRRLSVGPWALTESLPLEALLSEPSMTPLATAAARLLPVVAVDDADTAGLRAGRRVALPPAGADLGAPGPDDGSVVAVLGPAGELVALARVRGSLLAPEAVAPAA